MVQPGEPSEASSGYTCARTGRLRGGRGVDQHTVLLVGGGGANSTSKSCLEISKLIADEVMLADNRHYIE